MPVVPFLLLPLCLFFFPLGTPLPVRNHISFVDAHSSPLVLLDDRDGFRQLQLHLERVALVRQIVRSLDHRLDLGLVGQGHVVFDLLLLDLDVVPDVLIVQEPPWDPPLHNFRIQLQVSKNFVERHKAIHDTGVEFDQLGLELQNSNYDSFQNLLDIALLLWVHHLVVAVLQLVVDLQVFDVQQRLVVEAQIQVTSFSRQILDLDLLVNLSHALLPFSVVSCMRHGSEWCLWAPPGLCQ
mmetsp:Transcript_15598/g.39566  ORF Transcript_15598/g.39566 Transcript_15598/m.39566 type:complete len:239 (-) Transcript_15598:52-768(-)